MAYFVAQSSFSMSELDSNGHVKYIEDESSNKYAIRRGIDLRRMIDEIATGIKRVRHPGRRFVASQQMNVGVDFEIRYVNEDGNWTSTDNWVTADLSLWGSFKLKRSKEYRHRADSIVGYFDEIDWYNRPPSGLLEAVLLVPEGSTPWGGFQIYGGHNVNLKKFLKSSNKRRFSMLTKGDDVIIGTRLNDRLNGGKGDDFIYDGGISYGSQAPKRDILTGGHGQDTFYMTPKGTGYEHPPFRSEVLSNIALITDFNPSADRLMIPNHFQKNGSIPLETFLTKSPEGSWLVGKTVLDSSDDYPNGRDYFYTLANLKGIDSDEKFELTFGYLPEGSSWESRL